MQSKSLMERVAACFDRLGMNGVVLFVSQISPFALSPSKGERKDWWQPPARTRQRWRASVFFLSLFVCVSQSPEKNSAPGLEGMRNPSTDKVKP
jgi:hypothetical protein